MSRARHFARGAALSAFSTAVALVSLLLVGKMATNALPQDAVAVFLLALMLADGLNLLSNFGLFASAPKLIAEQASTEERGRLLGALLGGQLITSLCICAGLGIAVYFAAPLARVVGADPSALRTALIWSAPLSLLGAYRDLLLAVFAGLNRYGAHTGASVVFSAGQAVMVFLLVWLGEASVSRILLSVTIAQGVGVLMLLLLSANTLRPITSLKAYWAAVHFSAPLYVNTLLNFVFQRLDTLLVTTLLGLHAAAIYEIAKRFPQVLSRVLNALLLPWLPTVTVLLASHRPATAAGALRDVLCAITYLGYAGVLAAVPLSDTLVLLLAAPEYLDAAPLIAGLMAGIHLAVQAGVFGQMLVALGIPRAVTAGNVIQAVFSLGGAMLLLPPLGLAGMAYAWCAGAGLSLVIQAVALHRAGVRLPLGPYAALQGIFLAAAAIGAVSPGRLADVLCCGGFLLCGGLMGLAPLLRLARPVPVT